MKKSLLLTILVLGLSFYGCDNKSNSKSNSSIGETTPTGYTQAGGESVNGFILPPYPDPELNDSTLLGIDTNNNGVRDDVERWIIVKYKNHHKIVTEIGFQTARASQIVIQDPSRAKETYPIEDAAQDCNSYFERWAKYDNEPILIDHDIISSTAFKTIQLNTEQRIRAYLAYDKALSGGVYRSTDIDQRKSQCSFDIDKLLGE
jgi:hypothetical protein